ncbi:MAG TPA: peptidase, partial [Ktedonobacter sp.]|nr:peptidase [Ktedonobacter sp.]
VSEDDLWLVSSDGGRAERLTASADRANYPRFSPDGQLLAFVGHEEGPSDIYVMPALGGPAQRLTFQANDLCITCGWSPSGKDILYASGANQTESRVQVLFSINAQGGEPQQLPYGTANAISFGPSGGIVLGRNTSEMAYWKRYRGGRVGHLWCDASVSGTFKRLLDLPGNIASPCWVGERIYFLSDHEGISNIYSCTPQGEDVRRHTHQTDFYARSLSTDGQRMVFHAGGDLFLFDPTNEEVRRVDVMLPSQRTQLSRKFVPASSNIDTFALHPQGHSLAITTRGKPFSMGNWEGAVLQYGKTDGVRYRFLEWLNDGTRLIAVSDEAGQEVLVIFDEDGTQHIIETENLGRIRELEVSPTDDVIAIANHRHELMLVDLETGKSAVVDHSDYERIYGLAWSPDGSWLAYSFTFAQERRAIKLADLDTGQTHTITNPTLKDVGPSFDPDGKYLYFLGYRNFTPVRDTLQFDFGFPRGAMPYAIPLRRDMRSPFILEPKIERKNGKKEPPAEEVNPKSETETPVMEHPSLETVASMDELSTKEPEEPKRQRLIIDLEDITERALPFPVSENRYLAVQGIKGRVLFHVAAQPASGSSTSSNDHSGKASIESFDFETQRSERIVDAASTFTVSRDAKMLLYFWRRPRVIKAGEKPPRSENGETPGRETGWIDLSRVKVSVQPLSEWKQMFAEAWRVQRDQFWDKDMSGVNWQAMYERYAPLVERIGSRTELSDLIKELQGELSTSHSYEAGSREYRHGHHYAQGFLGVDWRYDEKTQKYSIAKIIKGDTSNSDETSPLTSPGLQVTEDDAVIAINGQHVTRTNSPQSLLVNQSDREVQLTLESGESRERRTITVRTLTDEEDARYRDWVTQTRQYVHAQSNGKVGYIHIPNMSAHGFAEFHRGYLQEFDAPALLIDVRWNTGGNVSELLLEKLARRRLGYAFGRWREPTPYPGVAPRGPMVALANEYSASDGDIFSHSFKLMGLGPLIGKRTWGGVVGIFSHHRMVDGTTTSQPAMAHWFPDIGWSLENTGAIPDIEVDISPDDYMKNSDPQLDRAIAEALRLLETYPTLEPRPGERPHLG